MFDKNGLYLATKKIGKNNPKAKQIKEDNEVRMQWNHEVDRALVSQVPEDEIRQIKQKWVTERIRLSINVFVKCPEKLAGIITTATAKLVFLMLPVAAYECQKASSADRRSPHLPGWHKRLLSAYS